MDNPIAIGVAAVFCIAAVVYFWWDALSSNGCTSQKEKKR